MAASGQRLFCTKTIQLRLLSQRPNFLVPFPTSRTSVEARQESSKRRAQIQANRTSATNSPKLSYQHDNVLPEFFLRHRSFPAPNAIAWKLSNCTKLFAGPKSAKCHSRRNILVLWLASLSPTNQSCSTCHIPILCSLFSIVRFGRACPGLGSQACCARETSFDLLRGQRDGCSNHGSHHEASRSAPAVPACLKITLLMGDLCDVPSREARAQIRNWHGDRSLTWLSRKPK